MKCADCKFWRVDPGQPDDDGFSVGSCRRYAPRPNLEIVQSLFVRWEDDEPLPAQDETTPEAPVHRFVVWPVTEGEDFCGEFAASKPKHVGYV